MRAHRRLRTSSSPNSRLQLSVGNFATQIQGHVLNVLELKFSVANVVGHLEHPSSVASLGREPRKANTRLCSRHFRAPTLDCRCGWAPRTITSRCQCSRAPQAPSLGCHSPQGTVQSKYTGCVLDILEIQLSVAAAVCHLEHPLSVTNAVGPSNTVFWLPLSVGSRAKSVHGCVLDILELQLSVAVAAGHLEHQFSVAHAVGHLEHRHSVTTLGREPCKAKTWVCSHHPRAPTSGCRCNLAPRTPSLGCQCSRAPRAPSLGLHSR